MKKKEKHARDCIVLVNVHLPYYNRVEKRVLSFLDRFLNDAKKYNLRV